MPLAGVRQVRIRGQVEPELAGQLAELREIQVEMRNSRGERVVLPPGRIVSLDRAKAGGLGRLLVEVDLCLSLPRPVEEQHASRLRLAGEIARVREESRATPRPRADPTSMQDQRTAIEPRKRGPRGLPPSPEKAARDVRIVEAWKAGRSQVEIGAEHGLSGARVCQILQQAGLIASWDVQDAARAERDAEIVRLRRVGWTGRDLCARYGIHRSRVSSILRRERERCSTPEHRCAELPRRTEISATEQPGAAAAPSRPKRRRLSVDEYAARNAEIVRMCESGMTHREISEQSGLGRVGVSMVLRRMGCASADRRGAHHAQRDAEIYDAWMLGAIQVDLGRGYDLSISRVKQILRAGRMTAARTKEVPGEA